MNAITLNSQLNTLGRTVTSQFFLDSTGFEDLRKRWKTLVTSDRKHELGSSAHLLYSILRGKDYRKAFGKVKRASKLSNGFTPYDGLKDALIGLFDYRGQLRGWLQELFGDLLTPDIHRQLSDLLIKVNECNGDELPGAYRMATSG